MSMASVQDIGNDAGALGGLAGRIAGSVHRPGEAAYDEACRI